MRVQAWVRKHYFLRTALSGRDKVSEWALKEKSPRSRAGRGLASAHSLGSEGPGGARRRGGRLRLVPSADPSSRLQSQPCPAPAPRETQPDGTPLTASG